MKVGKGKHKYLLETLGFCTKLFGETERRLLTKNGGTLKTRGFIRLGLRLGLGLGLRLRFAFEMLLLTWRGQAKQVLEDNVWQERSCKVGTYRLTVVILVRL